MGKNEAKTGKKYGAKIVKVRQISDLKGFSEMLRQLTCEKLGLRQVKVG